MTSNFYSLVNSQSRTFEFRQFNVKLLNNKKVQLVPCLHNVTYHMAISCESLSIVPFIVNKGVSCI